MTFYWFFESHIENKENYAYSIGISMNTSLKKIDFELKIR